MARRLLRVYRFCVTNTRLRRRSPSMRLVSRSVSGTSSSRSTSTPSPTTGDVRSLEPAMCGIVGIVNLNPRETVDEARLKRMRDVLRHRGPDGEGLWVDGPVGLGHRRLAIVDVAGGGQPMANADGTIWIVYNGEIYNHAALHPGLEARGLR